MSFLCVCQSVCQSVNIYFVSKISQELLYLETWNFVHMTSMTRYIVGKIIRAMGPGPLELFLFVVLAILMAMAFICVKDISGTTLLETWNFVHMTSMTSCIVGKKIRAMGPGPLELFPFVVLAILMAGGISEHMLTSWSSSIMLLYMLLFHCCYYYICCYYIIIYNAVMLLYIATTIL